MSGEHVQEIKSDQRAELLKNWALQQLPAAAWQWSALAGDASLRRYFRLHHESNNIIAVDAPNTSENNHAFVYIAEALQQCEVKTPKILAKDYDQGFLLIEDFGNRLLSHDLTAEQVDFWYKKASAELLKMQQARPDHFPTDYLLPEYNRERLGAEMNLFHEWFLARYLDYSVTVEERQLLENTYRYLEDNALNQPQAFVHRDYHSRNIMVLASGDSCPTQMGIIDFQDAVWGPVTYDLVSLLRDCYVKWPKEKVQAWAIDYARAKGLLAEVSEAQWLRWFDGMGLQRHIKVAGIFARLYLRDHKPGYLADIPRVLQYIVEVASDDPALAAFVSWLQEKIIPCYCAVYPEAKEWFAP